MGRPEEIKDWLKNKLPVHYHPGEFEPRLTPLKMHELEVMHAEILAYIHQLEAKLAEYEKPLVPMSWEEAMLDDAYLEVRDGDYVDMALNEFAMDVEDCGYVNYTKHGGIGYLGLREDYGKTWRCWSRRPTDEERKAAKWNEK